LGLARSTGWHLAASPVRGWLDEQRGPIVTRDNVSSASPHRATKAPTVLHARCEAGFLEAHKDELEARGQLPKDGPPW